MRTFTDESGQTWEAFVAEREGLDYKGRYHFQVKRDGDDSETLGLPEIQWNSRETAERTLATMSEVELRRRLRSAVGRTSSS
jgi:hypothetical protein